MAETVHPMPFWGPFLLQEKDGRTCLQCLGEREREILESLSRILTNYYTSLLSDHPPPTGNPSIPYLVNGWQQSSIYQSNSPYRVHYGLQNPAIHGIIITDSTMIPNFSCFREYILNPIISQVESKKKLHAPRTPRMVADTRILQTMLELNQNSKQIQDVSMLLLNGIME